MIEDLSLSAVDGLCVKAVARGLVSLRHLYRGNDGDQSGIPRSALMSSHQARLLAELLRAQADKADRDKGLG